MKKTVAKIEKFFLRWENSAPRWELIVAGFCALIVVRLLIENMLGLYTQTTPAFFFYEFSHTLLFFALTYSLVVLLFAHLFKRPRAGVATIFLTGFFVILTPPLIDVMISNTFFNGQIFRSYYEFDSLVGLIERFVTFYGADPTDGITYGVRIQVALALIFIATYGYSVSRNFLRTLGNTAIFYVLFFILGTMPSWLTLLFRGPREGFLAIDRNDIAALFLSPSRIFVDHISSLQTALNTKMSFLYLLALIGIALFFFVTHYKKYTHIFFAAMRPLQSMYHVGLLLFGVTLGILFSTEVVLFELFTVLGLLLLIVSVMSAWMSAALINDLCDRSIDIVSNTDRPLIQKSLSAVLYKNAAIGFFILSLFSATLVHPKVALLILAYHALTWLYNVPPLRFKRVPFLATAIAAIASLLIIATGFIVTTPGYSLALFPWVIALFLFLTYIFVLPIKDFKDMQGDRKAGVWTLPVLLGEKKTRLLVASALFISYIVSPIIFTLPQAMFGAVICGAFSFLVVIRGKVFDKKITPRQLPGVIFSIAVAYTGFLLLLLI